MAGYTDLVKEAIYEIECNKLFVANELRNTHLNEIPEQAYYKILERLTKNQELVHLSKGLYYRPIKKDMEIIPIGEESIIDYYTEKGSGVVIGESMYAEKQIIPPKAYDYLILSNNVKENRKRIGNIEIQKINMDVNKETKQVIQILDVLQNYNKLETINHNRFLVYMKKFAEAYSDEATQYVIENRKYKKSTIAFLKRMLTWHGVDNSLDKYLSALSDYKIPTIDELKVEVPEVVKMHLSEYVHELKRIYKEDLNRVLLYGSYARGDYDEDSDIDIMILLNMPEVDIISYRTELADVTYDFNESHHIEISPIAKNKDEFAKWVDAYPFYANVQRDGVELYGVA